MNQVNQVSWQNVLFAHERVGLLGTMQKYAKDLGYPYFMWNGKIHKTETCEVVDIAVI